MTIVIRALPNARPECRSDYPAAKDEDRFLRETVGNFAADLLQM